MGWQGVPEKLRIKFRRISVGIDENTWEKRPQTGHAKAGRRLDQQIDIAIFGLPQNGSRQGRLS